MTTAYTSLLGLALPVTGELSGTWGDVVNNSITSLVDTSVAGTTNISTDANVTLTTTTGASNQARQAILLFSGARTAIRTVTAPAQSKIYTVINATTGGFAVTLVGAGPTTGVTIANGARTVVAWNGSDFVEVSSPSSIILPGGTANGVLYLNGSKVVTSGSALTFDGTNFATTGNIRSSGANGNIGATGTTGNATLALQTNARLWTIGTSNSDSALYWRDETASAELMRLTSTGLGIGTSSPSQKLEVAGTGAKISNGTYTGYLGSGSTFAGGATSDFAVRSDNALVFASGGPYLRATIDSSGNLGLGVTPSAWDGSFKALQVSNTSLFSQDSTGAGWWSKNARNVGGTWYYIGTGNASYIEQGAGAFKWNTAASGTAGNAITFTQAATITANGDYLVGTTTDSGSSSNIKKVVGGNFRSFGNSATIPASSTGTVLTLSSSVTGVYIVNANFGPQGNAIYGGMLIVVANNGSFRIVTNGGGSSSALSLSGANVQITNAIGSPLDATASAIFIGN